MNTFGTLFRVTSFGESHGEAVGGVIDGLPAGIPVDMDFLQGELNRRRPGQSAITTQRRESDRLELLSGTFEGRTTGAPIGFLVRNEAQRSADYDALRGIYRPSHADYTYQMKYGVRDHRGGGRASARETLVRVVGGAFAALALREVGIEVHAFVQQVGSISLPWPYEGDLSETESNPVRCPHAETAQQMLQLITSVQQEGDTIGGCVGCIARGVPVGLGEPVAGKLHAALASAMLSINAAHGFDYGAGFGGLMQKGSEQNDDPVRKSNFSGGIQGGISNGAPIYFRVAFKPVATLLKEQPVMHTDGTLSVQKVHGRHDPCVLPRAVPVVEAMTRIVLLDFYLQNRARVDFCAEK